MVPTPLQTRRACPPTPPAEADAARRVPRPMHRTLHATPVALSRLNLSYLSSRAPASAGFDPTWAKTSLARRSRPSCIVRREKTSKYAVETVGGPDGVPRHSKIHHRQCFPFLPIVPMHDIRVVSALPRLDVGCVINSPEEARLCPPTLTLAAAITPAPPTPTNRLPAPRPSCAMRRASSGSYRAYLPASPKRPASHLASCAISAMARD